MGNHVNKFYYFENFKVIKDNYIKFIIILDNIIV